MEVYVRATHRYINGDQWRTLEIGNVNVKNPGKGRFTAFLDALLHFNPFPMLYIENVHANRFKDFFRRKGFTEIESTRLHGKIRMGPSCFYKEMNS